MSNKQIVKQFIENLFIDNDIAYAVVSDDVVVNWPGFGMEAIVGKVNLRNFLESGGPDKIIELKINNLIEEGNVVIGDGSIVTEKNGNVATSYFADVYTVGNDKITSLNSYMVFDQSNQ